MREAKINRNVILVFLAFVSLRFRDRTGIWVVFRYHFIKFSLVYMGFFDVGYGQLRIIPLIVLIDDFVAFRYHFRTIISRKILLTLSAAIAADQRGFGEIVIPNKMPTTEHTKDRNSVLYYRVDLALENILS